MSDLPDLDNLPNPDQFKLTDFPGVNDALIVEMVTAGNSRYLIDLFSHFRRGQLRAEMLAKVYFDQVEVYKRKLDEARGLDLTQVKTARSAPRPFTRAQPEKAPELDLALDL